MEVSEVRVFVGLTCPMVELNVRDNGGGEARDEAREEEVNGEVRERLERSEVQEGEERERPEVAGKGGIRR